MNERTCGLLFSILVCLLGFTAAAVSGDHTTVPPATAHPLLSESIGEAPGAGNDIRAVWLRSDEAGIDVVLACTAPITGGYDWGFFILFDTDRSAATGYPSGPLGVDYAVQVHKDAPGTLWVHRRIDGDNSSAWSRWTSETLTDAYTIVSGETQDHLEAHIPWKALGISDPGTAAVRVRISHNSPFLSLDAGEWAPDARQAYFTIGKDPLAMENAENLCRNGGFENLMEAAATPLPQDWTPHEPGNGAVEVSKDASEGKHALLMRSNGESAVGMDSALMQVRTCQVRFQYRGDAANAMEAPNLAVHMVAYEGPDGGEVARWSFVPPKEHIRDNAWHTGTIDVRNPPTGYFRICLRLNEGTAKKGSATWLVDDVAVYAIPQGAQINLAHTWCGRPLARVGEAVRFSTWLENGGDETAHDLELSLSTPEGLSVQEPTVVVRELPPGHYRRIDWTLHAEAPLRGPIRVTLEQTGAPAATTPNYMILVLGNEAPLDRQAVCTDDRGFWRELARPATLQESNTAALAPVRHLRSSEIGHNLYGICTQVPRSKDYETPFDPTHLIDGDASTVWSSQQRPNAYPGDAPWVEIELKTTAELAGLNLIPYWNNTDFPLGFRLLTQSESGDWETALRVYNHHLRRGGAMRGDKYVQSFPLESTVRTRKVRLVFERLPLSGGNYAEVSQGYKARLAGVELLDSSGHNVALTEAGAVCRASDFFTAWQSTAESIAGAFDRIFDIGLKWVRIGQWGDQTEWAAIEREKGVFKTDPVTDAAIEKLAANGVDILYGLNYGNHHYSNDEVWLDIGPIYREGGPFNWNIGPSTPEQREAFVRYVDFVVHRYKDYVKWWELWNEQNGWYPIHTGVISHQPELYGKLLHDVARHIKSIDPDLKVMYGGTAAPAPVSTEIALREGAAPYLDATAFHPYGAPMPEAGLGTMESASDGTNLGKSREQTGWEHLEDVIEGVREPFAEHGRPDIEVWMNEFGTNVEGLDFSYHPGIGEYGCAKYIMRFYLYSAWLKVPTAWWALHNLNRSQDWGIIDMEDYALRPMSYALQNVCSVVSDVEPMHGTNIQFTGDAPNLKMIAFRRTTRDEVLVLAWAAESQNDDVRRYPGDLVVPSERVPVQVTTVDLYWGQAQAARWTHEAGKVTIPRLILRDYPVAVILRYE